MAPTANQRKAAEALKAEGNSLFNRGRFLSAAECYTEALALLGPGADLAALLYVNRGMALKKAGDRWAQVVADASAALALDGSLFKAHYLAGVGQRELGCLAPAAAHLNKALEAARERGDAIKDEIWRELARTKYVTWQQESKQRTATAEALQQQLLSLLDQQHQHRQHQQHQQQSMRQWTELFDRAAHLDARTDVPSHLLCPLTMEVFREPVICPSGCTFERSALLEHLTRVGKWCPVTRTPMTESDVVLNVGLRNAVLHYLEGHPWAWAECC